MPLSKKILYQDFVDFFALLSAAFHLKSFCMSLHSTKRKQKPRTPDSLNWEVEIADIPFIKVYVRL